MFPETLFLGEVEPFVEFFFAYWFLTVPAGITIYVGMVAITYGLCERVGWIEDVTEQGFFGSLAIAWPFALIPLVAIWFFIPMFRQLRRLASGRTSPRVPEIATGESREASGREAPSPGESSTSPVSVFPHQRPGMMKK